MSLPQWGITNATGVPFIYPDSFVEIGHDANSEVNSHPIELGQFEGYNRVQQPRSIRLLLSCQGNLMPRSTFLSTLENLRVGTQLVTISMPDASYPNMALKSYSYKKTAERGAVTIWADTQWIEEQSQNVVVTSTPTARPQGAAVVHLGTLQLGDLTATLSSIVNAPSVLPIGLPADYASTAPPSGKAF